MNGSVLLLNGDFSVLSTITTKRAIVLVLKERAEVVSAYEGQTINSERLSFPLPSVVRLIRYVSIPRFRKAYLTRKGVLQRDNFKCAYCKCELTNSSGTIDHVHPRSRGGRHTWENVVAACYPCNQRKDDKTLEELGWKRLEKKPYRPEGAARIVLLVGDNPEWVPWLQVA